MTTIPPTRLPDDVGELPELLPDLDTPLRRMRERGRLRGVLAMLGPAFVAAVAYVDPGNFATNVAAGARYGFLLVWVIVVANLMAMLVQYLSAKTGVATGRDLPELCREHFPRPVTWGLWLQAELIAIATDLAEFVGAAIALNLLFGVPPLTAGFMTAAVAFGISRCSRAATVTSSWRSRLCWRSCCSGSPMTSRAWGSRSAALRPDSFHTWRGRTASCWPSASSERRSCPTSSTCTRR